MNDLIERMRLLELDHEPDGWPAVQMRDITALLDALEAYRKHRSEPVKVPEGYVLIAEDYLEVMIGPERMDHLRRSCRYRADPQQRQNND